MTNEPQKQNIVVVRDESSFDLRKTVFILLSKWPLFIVSIVCFMALGYLYIKSRTPVYVTRASVIIEQAKNAPEEQLLMQGLGFMSNAKNNIDNEIGIISSPDLIGKVIKKEALYVSYYWDDNYISYKKPIYLTTPLTISYAGEQLEKIPSFHTEITKIGKKYSLAVIYRDDEGVEHEEKYAVNSLPTRFEVREAPFILEANDSIPFNGREFIATVSNPNGVVSQYIRSMSVETSTQYSTQLNITFKTTNKAKGIDFLSKLIDEYNIDATADKNATSRNTAAFIDERLTDISQELKNVETHAENFRKAHKFTDLSAQGSAYLMKNEEYEKKLSEHETKLNLLQFIDKYLEDNSRQLIPNLGAFDRSLQNSIDEYNAMVVQLNRVAGSASGANPAASQLEAQIESYRGNIGASIRTEIKATNIQISDVLKERASTDAKIRTIPTIDREYTDILRQREVVSNLYSFLLQRREEVNLTQAGVAPKAKIIASPSADSTPMSPKKMRLYILFFVVSLLVPSLILYLRYYFQTKIKDISDLDGLTGGSVIGDISKASEAELADNRLVVHANDDSIISEMFRTMRNNLLFMLGEHNHNVILVTSTIPKEGKTFISSNLAMTLSLMDKKVILVGADLRNPQLSHNLNIGKPESGLSSYLAGMNASVDELIEEFAPNYHILQAGPIPPNPNELLSNDRMKGLIDTLRERYDYVIIDSAPVGVVSDTFTIAKFVDAVVYVVRENFSQKDTVPFINNLAADGRLHNVAVVLNMTEVSGRKAKYKYGATKYGYKYSYRYRYGYAQKYDSGSVGKRGKKGKK